MSTEGCKDNNYCKEQCTNRICDFPTRLEIYNYRGDDNSDWLDDIT